MREGWEVQEKKLLEQGGCGNETHNEMLGKSL